MLASRSPVGLVGRHLAFVLLAVPIALVTFAPAARAAAPVAIGWWEEAQQTPASPTLPAPPDVPPGGLFVANGAMGAVGVSALKFASPGPGTLRLDVAPNSPGAGVATVDACLPLSAWPAEQNGPWRDVPQYDCGNAVTGVLKGSTFEWKLPPSYARGSGLQVVLAPHPGLGTPFQVGFNPPGTESFSPAVGAASEPTTATPSTILGSTTLPSSSSSTTLPPLLQAIRPVLPLVPSSGSGVAVLGESVAHPTARAATTKPAPAASAKSRHLAMIAAAALGLMAVVFGSLFARRALSARSSSRP